MANGQQGAYANGQQGAYASAPLHMHSPFHHWSIVTIFCIVSVVFYFGVYIILTDSNVESKKILTSHLIHKNGGSGNSNTISISTTSDSNSGNSRTVSSAIVRSPGNRSKGWEIKKSVAIIRNIILIFFDNSRALLLISTSNFYF